MWEQMLEKDWWDLKLMHQAPFLLVKDLSNVISAKVGDMLRVSPSCLNYTRGECQKRKYSSPKTGACKNTDSNHRRDPIITKAVKMADRYHNSDPLIQLIGPVTNQQ